jgi:hypothetical protein
VVLVGRDPQGLNLAFAKMREFAEQRLRVRFHPDKTARNTCDKGINFCGQILKPHRTYIRSRTARAMKAVAHSPQRQLEPALWTARMNSYLGQCRHANTFSLRKQLAIDTGAAFAPGLNKVIRRPL